MERATPRVALSAPPGGRDMTGILRSIFLAAALAAALLAPATAAASDRYTCRFDGSGEGMTPAIPSIAQDGSLDDETGFLELRTFGECVIERTSGTRTIEPAQMGGLLQYTNQLCGTMRWYG